MEPEQRGRTSRASSTSSLEVRCGCQFYQSDSLLPERRALIGRPPSRTMQQPPAVRCSEHEYEPIAPPLPQPMTAPVVRITDTDAVHVADSDDSIDDRGRLPPELILDGDVVLPLDGRIEDSAMEGRELVETGDTSEELESPQQLQDRLEERFLSAATPCTESRTDGEVNTSQVDSSTLEELPLRRGARGIQQRIKCQAGKLRSRLRGIQRPTFSFAGRRKTEKARSTSSGKSDKSKTEKARSTSSGKSEKSKTEKRPSRMERIRSSLPDRPRFSLPERPKFNFPERAKFHMPEKAKFHLPERPKFNIKRPNIRLPSALSRKKQPPPPGEQRSTDSTVGSKRKIFDFSTYPRIFDRKSKKRGEYATSSPKDSRAQSAESATFPRTKKGLPVAARWTERYEETQYIDEDNPDEESTAERDHPWRHPPMEEPRLSIRMEQEVLMAAPRIPWEEARRKQRQKEQEEEEEDEEDLRYMDYEQESTETSDRQALPTSQEISRNEEENYKRERLKDDRFRHSQDEEERGKPEEWDEEVNEPIVEFRPIQRSRSLGEEVIHIREDKRYEGSFPAVDPRKFDIRKMHSEEEEEKEIEEDPDISGLSDREQQQSSGSSCDRRRRGIIEEIDSDEFFLRASGLSQDDMVLEKYLTNEIRNAFRSDTKNALADDSVLPSPPKRPERTRSLRKRKEELSESYEAMPPVRPRRERSKNRQSQDSMSDAFRERSNSISKHRIVYQMESSPQTYAPDEQPDDIVVVKPTRRKSRSSLRSQSQVSSDVPIVPATIIPDTDRPSPPIAPLPPAVPTRRKRLRKEPTIDQRNGEMAQLCNGHRYSEERDLMPKKFQDDQQVVMKMSQEDVRNLALRIERDDYIEPVPVPPKRRSRSTSVAQDEDRTSHGAESLPEGGYEEEDIPRDETDSTRDLPGYAIIDKREKPPRPPPPRRKRNKFATTPRPTAPKRPQRAYSTLGPARTRDSSIMSDTSKTLEPADSTPYIEIDMEETDHKSLRSGEVLSRMQGRPLPAPPRPPRIRKEQTLERMSHATEDGQSMELPSMEVSAATQTDPLPDDMVIEEEITQAKLIVAPSRSGSQIMVSTERIPSPTGMPTPPVPPLPISQYLRADDEVLTASDAMSQRSASPLPDHEKLEEKRLPSSRHEEDLRREEAQAQFLRSALADETLRIASLEVGDLKVDRLSVSQLEAHRIVASEVDALVITASELKGLESVTEDRYSPSIIKELIAIRSHLETVATSQAQERQRLAETEGKVAEKVKTESEKPDIPTTDTSSIQDSRIEEMPQPTTDQPSETPEKEKDDKPTEEVKKVVKSEIQQITMKEVSMTPSFPVIQDAREEMSATLTQPTIQDTREETQVLSSDTFLSPGVMSAADFKAEEAQAMTSLVEAAREQSIERGSLSDTESQHRVDTSIEERKSPTPPLQHSDKESTPDTSETKTSRKSKSRSPSPSRPVRQTASPVRQLPPVISVTPDSPDTVPGHNILSDVQPQRAVISYSEEAQQIQRDSQRESSQSPIPSLPVGATHFIAFPASQIPSQFFALDEPSRSPIEQEPCIADAIRELLRALRHSSVQNIRHFVRYINSRISREDSRDKIRDVELALCVLLILVACLLVVYISSSQTITHHHHWDYFNPPQ